MFGGATGGGGWRSISQRIFSGKPRDRNFGNIKILKFNKIQNYYQGYIFVFFQSNFFRSRFKICWTTQNVDFDLGLFGGGGAPASSGGGLFGGGGAAPASSGGGLFGGAPASSGTFFILFWFDKIVFVAKYWKFCLKFVWFSKWQQVEEAFSEELQLEEPHRRLVEAVVEEKFDDQNLKFSGI